MRSRTSVAVAAAIATAMGALTLLPTYAGLHWLPVTWGAVLVVAIAAQGARLLGVPAWLSPVIAALVLTGYVTAVFAGGVATLGFLPGHAARTVLGDLSDQGWHDVSVLHAPVPTGKSLVLLTACGVGLVAIAVDLIAVVLRRPALAGLPLLALFAVSAATVPHGVGWLPFVYAGIGYLALLMAEGADRIGRWGHPLGAGAQAAGGQPLLRPERARTTPLIHVGRRVGFAAIAVAVVVPAVIPGLHPGLFGTGGGTGAGFGSGKSTVTTYNPILKIRQQLQAPDHQPLLRYQSNDTDPPYLRMTALDQYDGSGWTQGDLVAPPEHRVSKGVPAPFGVGADIPTVTTESTIAATDDLRVPWLPLPYPSVDVDVDKGDWRWDDASRAIFSTQTTTRGRTWKVKTARLTPTRADLDLATIEHPPSLDGDVAIDSRVRVPLDIYDLARRVTRKAKTPFQQALALQNFFHSAHFTYTLEAPSDDSTDAIESFLHDGRGYCVQFAASMALLARTLNIPARVAIGFTHGTQQTDGSFVVTTADAHAWPELYFDNIGWLAFEPTPRGDGQAQPPSYTLGTPNSPRPSSSPGSAGPTAGPTPTPGPSLSSNARRALDEPLPVTFGKKKGRGPWGTVGLVGLIVVLLASVPAVARILTRRRRWGGAETGAARAHTAWRELADDARDLGYHWRFDDSPRRAAARLTAASGLTHTRGALRRLAAAEERARYARTLDHAEDLAVASREVRHELAALAGRRRRFAARLVPRSTIVSATSFAANRIADLLDLIDVAVAVVVQLVVPRRLRRTEAR